MLEYTLTVHPGTPFECVVYSAKEFMTDSEEDAYLSGGPWPQDGWPQDGGSYLLEYAVFDSHENERRVLVWVLFSDKVAPGDKLWE